MPFAAGCGWVEGESDLKGALLYSSNCQARRTTKGTHCRRKWMLYLSHQVSDAVMYEGA